MYYVEILVIVYSARMVRCLFPSMRSISVHFIWVGVFCVHQTVIMSAKQLTGNFMGIQILRWNSYSHFVCIILIPNLHLVQPFDCAAVFSSLSLSLSNASVIAPDEVHLLPFKLFGIAINSLNMHTAMNWMYRAHKKRIHVFAYSEFVYIVFTNVIKLNQKRKTQHFRYLQIPC